MKKIRLLLLVCLLLPATSWAENQALLIGINRYENVNPPLKGSEVDVENIKNLALNQLGFKESQVHTLEDEQATKEMILQAIKEHLIAKTKPNDRVLFYFSGHGFQIKDEDNDESKDGLDETLVTHDAGRDKKTGAFVNMISDDELGDLLDSIDDRQVTVIIDSCHSGTITRGFTSRGLGKRTSSTPTSRPDSVPASTYLEKSIQDSVPATFKSFKDVTDNPVYQQHRQEEPFITSTGNRIVWSAVTAGQKALVDFTGKKIQGVFTRWFIDGLVNKNADQDGNGRVSNVELLTYTREKSAWHCQHHGKKACKLGLTPMLQAPMDKMSASLIHYSGFSNPPSMSAPTTQQPVVAAPPPVTPQELPDSVLPTHKPASVAIQVEVNGKATNTIKLGESLFIAINSEREGYLLLLDRDAKGNIKQLYPNPSIKKLFIPAKKDIFVPESSTQFEIKATEVGRSQLIAIVTHDQIELKGITQRVKDLKPISQHEDYLHLLSQRLHSTWTKGKVNRAVDYAISKFEYVVFK